MTTWLTRIVPDTRSRDARRDLAATAATGMHRRLMSLYPPDAGPDPRAQFGVLFRIEDTPAGPQILLQSNHQPDLTQLPDGYGHSQTRTLDELLDHLRPGLPIRYRCIASPIRKPGATTRQLYNLPAVVPLTGTAADEWWIRQAEQAGIKPLTHHTQLLDAATGLREDHQTKKKQRIRHTRHQFDGTAAIIDTELLRNKITQGIGQGKPYGCGLLTIAPTRAHS